MAGALQLTLINGFNPGVGNSFDILDWGTINGTFSSLLLPSLGAGLSWDTSQLYSTGAVSVVSTALPGDYNRNGIVDAADYTLWRDTLGSTTNLAADGNGNGQVDQADFNIWKNNFGNHAGSGAGAEPVPEPPTVLLLALAIGLMETSRRRSRLRFNNSAPQLSLVCHHL